MKVKVGDIVLDTSCDRLGKVTEIVNNDVGILWTGCHVLEPEFYLIAALPLNGIQNLGQ